MTSALALALAPVPGTWNLSVRAFRCWLVTYRRTWRSSIWSSVFGPLFYLGSMGYGLGSLVDKNGTARRSAACRTWCSSPRPCSPPSR